ncbi:MAG: HIT domain-containing protein [Armatimonadetes bacterium]|nr:HIT domain-containing protein [Armatimonadota bacterium]
MTERLWAPWRFDYVRQASAVESGQCLFCEVLNAPSDRDGLVLYRGDKAYVMLNAFPYTSGHVMVAPYRHGNDVQALDESELLDVGRLVQRAVGWLKTAYRPEGFNIGANVGSAAGAGIPQHLHWHVVPRWAGDTNFMTAVGNVRVIPQDLRETWDKLRAVIEAE